MARQALAVAAEAAPGVRRVGVLVIGSNSVRLVVFDGLHRNPVPVFNEKVICGLGRGLSASGRLAADGLARVFPTVDRFAKLAGAMELARLDVLATAAVREAEDGRDFVAELERRHGFEVRVLSGEEEARLSALGVISAEPRADGVMGDLGGGSLELAALDDGRLGSQITLPLGQLRLREMAEADAKGARKLIDDHLASLTWLAERRGRALYAVGGGWRALARLDIAESRYPLRILHGYALPLGRALKLAEKVSGMNPQALERIPGLPRKRLELMPYAALALARLLRALEPARLVFSAHGLREGWLFDQLADEVRRRDPLIEACRELASRDQRFAEHGAEMAAWLAPLFADDDGEDRRLRLAASLLSEVAWRAHPDHRAEEALFAVLWAPVAGVDHPGRAFIALAVHARYAGRDESAAAAQAAKLLDAERVRKALVLGLALRLGHTLSGGAPGMLEEARLELAEDRLALVLSRRAEALMGEVVQRRLGALGRALERPTEVEISD